MLKTPEQIRELQTKLYQKAKQDREFRFYALYDKVYRKDIIEHAYRLIKANKGAPGVDGITFEAIEEQGAVEYLETIIEELHTSRTAGLYPETGREFTTTGHPHHQRQGRPDGGEAHLIRGRLPKQFLRLQTGKKRPSGNG
jgi:hypothetical protein